MADHDRNVTDMADSTERRGSRIDRGGRILLRAYAGVDPDTGKRQYLNNSVPATAGKREINAAQRKLTARADALAAERRAVRMERLTPKQRAERALCHGGEITFREAAEDWWSSTSDQLQIGGRNTPRVILDAYLLPRIGDVELWRLRPTVTPTELAACAQLVSIKALYDELERQGARPARGETNRRAIDANSMPRIAGILKQVLGYAVQRGWLAANPARETRPSPYRQKRRPLPGVADMSAFLAYLLAEADPRHRPGPNAPMTATFARLLMSGPRPNEILALRISDLDLSTRMLTVGTQGLVPARDDDGHYVSQLVQGDTEKRRERSLRVSLQTVAAWQAVLREAAVYADLADVVLRPDAFLFSAVPDRDVPLATGSARQAFERWRDRARKNGVADLPEGMVPYDCRHYAITRLLEAGQKQADVALRFGTSVRMINETYWHAIPGNDDEMADILDAAFGSATDVGAPAPHTPRRRAHHHRHLA